jgi:hypothetical protein
LSWIKYIQVGGESPKNDYDPDYDCDDYASVGESEAFVFDPSVLFTFPCHVELCSAFDAEFGVVFVFSAAFHTVNHLCSLRLGSLWMSFMLKPCGMETMKEMQMGIWQRSSFGTARSKT